MRMIAAALYLAAVTGANAALAEGIDWESLRTGDMRKLRVHSEPYPASDEVFVTEDGGEARLTDYTGQITLVNFWATWCGPCRKEMPTLSALQAELGGEDFEVVTIATGRNPPQAMLMFFAEIGVDNLPLHRDDSQRVARDMGVLGLPVTLILDREGQEIARLQGDADWFGPEAVALIEAVIAAE